MISKRRRRHTNFQFGTKKHPLFYFFCNSLPLSSGCHRRRHHRLRRPCCANPSRVTHTLLSSSSSSFLACQRPICTFFFTSHFFKHPSLSLSSSSPGLLLKREEGPFFPATFGIPCDKNGSNDACALFIPFFFAARATEDIAHHNEFLSWGA